MGRPIYGYMRAYEMTPEAEVRRDELLLTGWARDNGYELVSIYQETEEGSIAVLRELIERVRLTQDSAVVVPSYEHFGTSRVLREQLADFLVHCTDAPLYEASDQ